MSATRQQQGWIAAHFCRPTRADTVLGGQFGSEGKGAAVAWLAATLARRGKHYNIVTCNSGSQAGHTAVHKDVTYVTRHLPTYPLISPGSVVYLNAGCAIDPDVLKDELERLEYLNYCTDFFIHPNAAVITPDCIASEGHEDSAQTKIGSTRKGVGEAIARKVLRSGQVAKDHPYLKQFVRALDLNQLVRIGKALLIEIPQGYGLSLNKQFYPYCTSRDCTVMQAMSDAHLHPSFLGQTMLVLRAHPIRVGGTSGGFYGDQFEINWQSIGVTPEVTTVTQRVRRVFTWSHAQVCEAMVASRPSFVLLTHCDYLKGLELDGIVNSIQLAARTAMIDPPQIGFGYGPTTEDIGPRRT